MYVLFVLFRVSNRINVDVSDVETHTKGLPNKFNSCVVWEDVEVYSFDGHHFVGEILCCELLGLIENRFTFHFVDDFK